MLIVFIRDKRNKESFCLRLYFLSSEAVLLHVDTVQWHILQVCLVSCGESTVVGRGRGHSLLPQLSCYELFCSHHSLELCPTTADFLSGWQGRNSGSVARIWSCSFPYVLLDFFALSAVSSTSDRLNYASLNKPSPQLILQWVLLRFTLMGMAFQKPH